MPPKIVLRRCPTTSSIASTSTSVSTIATPSSSSTTSAFKVIGTNLSSSSSFPVITTTTNNNDDVTVNPSVTLDPKFASLTDKFSKQFLLFGGDSIQTWDLHSVFLTNDNNEINVNNNFDPNKLAENPTSPTTTGNERKMLVRRYRMIAHAVSSSIAPTIIRVLTNAAKKLHSSSSRKQKEGKAMNFEILTEILDEVVDPLLSSSLSSSADRCSSSSRGSDVVIGENIIIIDDDNTNDGDHSSINSHHHHNTSRKKVAEVFDDAVYTLCQDAVAIETCLESNVLSLVSYWRSNLIGKICSPFVVHIVEQVQQIIQEFLTTNNNNINDDKGKNLQELYKKLEQPYLLPMYRRLIGTWRESLQDLQMLLTTCRTTRLQLFKNFAAGEALLYQCKILEADLLREQSYVLSTAHALHQTLFQLLIFSNSLLLLASSSFIINQEQSAPKLSEAEREKLLFRRRPRNQTQKQNSKKNDDDDDDQQDDDEGEEEGKILVETKSSSSLPFSKGGAEFDKLIGIRSSEFPNCSLISFFPVFLKYQDGVVEAPFRGTAFFKTAMLVSSFPVFSEQKNNTQHRHDHFSSEQDQEKAEYEKEDEQMHSLNICYWIMRAICSPKDSVDYFEQGIEMIKKILKKCAKEIFVDNQNDAASFDTEILAISHEMFSKKLKREEISQNALDVWKTRMRNAKITSSSSVTTTTEKFWLRYSILFLLIIQGDQNCIQALLEYLVELFATSLVQIASTTTIHHHQNSANEDEILKQITSTTLPTAIALLLNNSQVFSSLTSRKLLSIRDWCDSLQNNTNCELMSEFLAAHSDEYNSLDFIITPDTREMFGLPKTRERFATTLFPEKYEQHQLRSRANLNKKMESDDDVMKNKMVKSFLNISPSSTNFFSTEKILPAEYRDDLSTKFNVGLHRHDEKFVERSFATRSDVHCLRILNLSKAIRKYFE